MRYKELFDEATEKAAIQIGEHSFLKRCASGNITLDELRLYLTQQSKVGSGFTRCLCALMSNVHTNTQMLHLAENLFEELGFEDKLAVPHTVMYQQMLSNIGVSPDAADALPETRALADMRERLCRDRNPSYGLAALYRFETLVPPMFVEIIKGFKACGISEADLEFFTIHASCDDGHAETMRDIMVEIAEKDASQAKIMLDTAAAITNARYDFFSGIEKHHLASQGSTNALVGRA